MKYRSGDFVGVVASDFTSRLASKVMGLFIIPKTNLFHFFWIRTPIPDENDYEIKEAIPSGGMRDGRFSWYQDKEYRVFRILGKGISKKSDIACAKYSRYGRYNYNFLLSIKLLFGLVYCLYNQLVKEHKFRKIHVSELPYAQSDEFVCTEAVYEISYLMGCPIMPPNEVSIPPSIIEALENGKIKEVTKVDEIWLRRLSK